MDPERTPTGRHLLRLFDRLTGSRPIRANKRLFPVIALEPEETTVESGAYLGMLEDAARATGIPHISPQLGSGLAEPPSMSAIALLDTMAERRIWHGRRSHLGQFRFPRSELVRSFELAVAEAGEDGASKRPPHQLSADAMAAWNDKATLFPGWGGPLKASAWMPALGAAVAAAFTGLAGLSPALPIRYALVTLGAIVVAALLLLVPLTRREMWLPVVSHVGFGGRFRWFATSSFFAGGDGFDGQLHGVFDQLVNDDSADFRLQMRTFAFLEDLRHNYRKFSLDLRGFKRSIPPVVFLRSITADNGGVELLSAMSDIRSRRSEIHPLLVVASVDFERRKDLGGLPEMPGRSDGGSGGPRRSVADLYKSWTYSLATAQSPSGDVPLPWLFRVPLPDEPSDDEPAPTLARRRRPRWTWLWSWRAAIATVLVLALAAMYAQTRLRTMYCQVGFPLSWNQDTRLRTNADGGRECVGVATRGVSFERGPNSIGLDGELRRPDPHHGGGQITLADLLRRIEDENDNVVRSGEPYVTVLYAGMLTAEPARRQLPVDAIKELAGGYLAQLRNNATGQPGEVGNPLKMLLRAVNVGQDMAFADDAVDHVLDIARRDRTVVGVVGMAHNTQNSQRAVRRLSAAGLPVISTVNSSDTLPAVPHYYAMAATDYDEAAALRPAVRRELGDRPVDRALVVRRDPGPSLDVYSGELAADVEAVLAPRLTDTVSYVGADDIASKVKTACENAGTRPYSLVYFAGRAEDLPGLMNGLTGGGCTRREITLLAGDEVATVRFGTSPHEVPLDRSIKLYFTAFAYLPTLIAGDNDLQNAFFLLARNLLGIGAPRVARDEPLLVDAQMALAFDATTSLAEASQNAFSALGLTRSAREPVPGSGSVTSGAVLLELRRLLVRQAATGDIDFRRDRHVKAGTGNRGLVLVEVTLRDGRPVSTPVCGRLAGPVPLPGLPACPR